MQEPINTEKFNPAILEVHAENQQFVNSKLLPNIFYWYQQRTDMIKEIITKYIKIGSSILDIGCAQGTIAITLSDYGYKVTANDIRENYIEYAKLRDNNQLVEFISGNFLDLDFQEKFNAVILTEVIEHLINHQIFIDRIYENLGKDGILIITTPNYDFINQRLPSYSEINFKDGAHQEFTADGDDHFYIFKKSELIELTKKSKFIVLEHTYFLTILEFGTFKLRYLWKILPKSVILFFNKFLIGNKYFSAQQCLVLRKQ